MELPIPPLNCPYCGTPLVLVVRGVSGVFRYYHCREHGRFWLDFDGKLQESTPGQAVKPSKPDD
jgi:hypothetical protein